MKYDARLWHFAPQNNLRRPFVVGFRDSLPKTLMTLFSKQFLGELIRWLTFTTGLVVIARSLRSRSELTDCCFSCFTEGSVIVRKKYNFI